MELYYKIWADNILGIKSQKENKNTWKRDSKISMNIPMVANLLTIMLNLQSQSFQIKKQKKVITLCHQQASKP